MLPSSSSRFNLEPAPAGLAFVQDLVNTAVVLDPAPFADLLATPEDAQSWLDNALEDWSSRTGQPKPTVRLTAYDARRLQRLREQIRALLKTRTSGTMTPQLVALDVDQGKVAFSPGGSGWKAVAALIYAELLLAQRTGTWARLKSCENTPCSSCFYDRSKNNGRVWHARVCGNAINLRASRARKSRTSPNPPTQGV
jgi:predicted RNA-binding Zn ribbon-like protein